MKITLMVLPVAAAEFFSQSACGFLRTIFCVSVKLQEGDQP